MGWGEPGRGRPAPGAPHRQGLVRGVHPSPRQTLNPKPSLACTPPLAPCCSCCCCCCCRPPREHALAQQLALGYWSFHYAKRILETFFVHK